MKRKCQPIIGDLIGMCRASPGCVGYEWVSPYDIRAAYLPGTTDHSMFDAFLDSGAKVVGEAPLKPNEAEFPYISYLVRWPDRPPGDLRAREGLELCRQLKKPTLDS